jgi:hypothetical protein
MSTVEPAAVNALVVAAKRALNQLQAANESLGAEFLEEEELSEACDAARRLAEALAAIDASPETLVLHCPRCGKLHLDTLEPDGTDWSKRPHKTHLCKNTPFGANTGCGHEWRPKETPTVGVSPPVEREHGPLISRKACRQLAWDWLRRAGDDGENTRIQGMKDAHFELIELVGLSNPTAAEEAARVRLGAWLAAVPGRSWSRTVDPTYFWLSSPRGCWGGTLTEALDQADAHDADLAAKKAKAERFEKENTDANRDD